MKTTTLVMLVVTIAVTLFILIPNLSWAAEDGAALYKTKCAACHGPDGKGEVPMGKKLGARDLSSTEVQSQSDGQLSEILTKGKNKMPSYDGKLTKEQIGQLVAYIRDFGKKH